MYTTTFEYSHLKESGTQWINDKVKMCVPGLEENIHTQEFTSVMREEFTTVEGKGGVA